jgi:putative acyl-CoA dehydrogenase
MAISQEPRIYGTHEVINQPKPLEPYNLYTSDTPLREGIARGEAQWHEEALTAFGAKIGTAEHYALGRDANRFTPVLETHDRFGRRLDTVNYHPAYHELMKTGIEAQMHALPWNESRRGAFVARAAIHYMHSQIEAGTGCPITMTFAVVPSLLLQPEVAAEWMPRVTAPHYDPRHIPAQEKKGCTMGMFLTEKQGGSDVRANKTQAVPIGAEGPGQEYLLTGHKWFCSAPMSDAFLMTAYTSNGISCFLVPRILPDGSNNHFYIQRLKDKVGNRSNASSEIEFLDTWGVMVGEEAHGVRNIIQMVNHTRLDCAIGTAGIMRQSLAQAIQYASTREAFGELLAEQPLMQNVLADLALESEAATTMMMRLAQSFDEEREDPEAGKFKRIATAISKYWICKRAPGMVYECMECLGGVGYVEETILPRLYREAPVNSIWEGSGNVITLDMLRALQREPECVPILFAEFAKARGADKRYDAFVDKLQALFNNQEDILFRARRIIEGLALAIQASQLIQHAPNFVSEPFVASRLGGDYGHAYGTLPTGTDAKRIIERARAL